MATVTNSNGTVLWHSALPCGCGVINSENEGFTSLLTWTPFLPCYLPCDSTGGVLLLSQAHQYVQSSKSEDRQSSSSLLSYILLFVMYFPLWENQWISSRQQWSKILENISTVLWYSQIMGCSKPPPLSLHQLGWCVFVWLQHIVSKSKMPLWNFHQTQKPLYL